LGGSGCQASCQSIFFDGRLCCPKKSCVVIAVVDYYYYYYYDSTELYNTHVQYGCGF
jgi:hypothetical protein